jgi:hypothetical protein
MTDIGAPDPGRFFKENPAAVLPWRDYLLGAGKIRKYGLMYELLTVANAAPSYAASLVRKHPDEFGVFSTIYRLTCNTRSNYADLPTDPSP